MKKIITIAAIISLCSCASTVSNCHGTHGCIVDRGDTATGVLNAIGNIIPSIPSLIK